MLLLEGYSFTLSADENMLEHVLPGLLLATPLSFLLLLLFHSVCKDIIVQSV